MRLAVPSLIVAVLLASSVLAAAAPETPVGPALPPKPPSESPPESKTPAVQIAWQADLEAALKEAAASGRIVMVFFHADWCQPCRWMNDWTFASAGIARYVLEHFVPVKSDDSKQPGEISKKYSVRLYPTLLFLSGAGEPLHMVLGSQTPAQLLPILQLVQSLPKLMEAQKKAPDDVEANFTLGGALASLDQLKRAEPYLARIAKLDPANKSGHLAQVRLLLALVPIEDGEAAQAIKNIDQFCADFKGDPLIPTALFFKGTILFRESKFEEARQVYEQIRTDYPKHAKAYEADKAIDAIEARLKAKEAEKAPPAAKGDAKK